MDLDTEPTQDGPIEDLDVKEDSELSEEEENKTETEPSTEKSKFF